ncbi:MAG: hypothetical protein DIU80_000965 [Chloroflexota bacterium]
MVNTLTVALLVLRRLTGLVLLAIGVLGLLLPILPGWPFIIPAVVLLGRRNRIVRMLHLMMRYTLRALRRSRSARLRALGWRLSSEYVRARRMVMPAINATERAFSGRWFAA